MVRSWPASSTTLEQGASQREAEDDEGPRSASHDAHRGCLPGSAAGSTRIQHPHLIEAEASANPAHGIGHDGDAVVGGAHQRQAILDRSHPGHRQMLVGAGAAAEPGVVGDVEDPVRMRSGRDRPARKDRLVADERAEGRDARQADRAPPRDPARNRSCRRSASPARDAPGCSGTADTRRTARARPCRIWRECRPCDRGRRCCHWRSEAWRRGHSGRRL